MILAIYESGKSYLGIKINELTSFLSAIGFVRDVSRNSPNRNIFQKLIKLNKTNEDE